MSAAMPIPGCWTSPAPCRPRSAATGLRWGQYWFPEIRSLPGAALMLAMVLYPYVYLLCRNAFQQQSVCLLEASRTLGHSLGSGFLAAGAADGAAGDRRRGGAGLDGDAGGFRHGAAFRRPHLHHGHLRGLVRPRRPRRRQPARGLPDGAGGAAAGAGTCLARRRGASIRPPTAIPSSGRCRCMAGRRAAAFILCALPVGLGFLLPAGTLLALMLQVGDPLEPARFLPFARNSVVLAALAATAAVLAGRLPRLGGAAAPAGAAAAGGARGRARLCHPRLGHRGGRRWCRSACSTTRWTAGCGRSSASRPGCCCPAGCWRWSSPIWSASWRWRSRRWNPGSGG